MKGSSSGAPVVGTQSKRVKRNKKQPNKMKLNQHYSNNILISTRVILPILALATLIQILLSASSWPLLVQAASASSSPSLSSIKTGGGDSSSSSSSGSQSLVVAASETKLQRSDPMQQVNAKIRTPRWTHFGARLQPLTNQNPSLAKQQHQSHQTKRADVTNQGHFNQQQQQQMDSSPEAFNHHQQSSSRLQSLLVGLDEDVMLSLMRQAELADDDFESDQPRQQQQQQQHSSTTPFTTISGQQQQQQQQQSISGSNENNNRDHQKVASAERRNSADDQDGSGGSGGAGGGGNWMSTAVDPLVADLQFRNAHIHKVDDSDDQVRGQPQTNNKFRKQRKPTNQWNHHKQQQSFAQTSGAFINPAAVHHQRAESSQATSFAAPKQNKKTNGNRQQQVSYSSTSTTRRGQHSTINNNNNSNRSGQSSHQQPRQCPTDGIYADPVSGCQSYHICQSHIKTTFQCPLGTLFNNAILTCDFAHNVECEKLAAQFNHFIDDNSILDSNQDGANGNELGDQVTGPRPTEKPSPSWSITDESAFNGVSDNLDDKANGHNLVRNQPIAAVAQLSGGGKQKAPEGALEESLQEPANPPLSAGGRQQVPVAPQQTTSHTFTQVIHHVPGPQTSATTTTLKAGTGLQSSISKQGVTTVKPLKGVPLKKATNIAANSNNHRQVADKRQQQSPTRLTQLPPMAPPPPQPIQSKQQQQLQEASPPASRQQQQQQQVSLNRQSGSKPQSSQPPIAIDLTNGRGSSMSADRMIENGVLVLVKHPEGSGSENSATNGGNHHQNKKNNPNQQGPNRSSQGQAYAVEASAVKPDNSLDSVVFPHVQNLIATNTASQPSQSQGDQLNQQQQQESQLPARQQQQQTPKLITQQKQQQQTRQIIKVSPIPPPMTPPTPQQQQQQVTTTSSPNLVTIQFVGRQQQQPTVASQTLRQQIPLPSNSNGNILSTHKTPNYATTVSSASTTSTTSPKFQRPQHPVVQVLATTVEPFGNQPESDQRAPQHQGPVSLVEHSIAIDHNIQHPSSNSKGNDNKNSWQNHQNQNQNKQQQSYQIQHQEARQQPQPQQQQQQQVQHSHYSTTINHIAPTGSNKHFEDSKQPTMILLSTSEAKFQPGQDSRVVTNNWRHKHIGNGPAAKNELISSSQIATNDSLNSGQKLAKLVAVDESDWVGDNQQVFYDINRLTSSRR